MLIEIRHVDGHVLATVDHDLRGFIATAGLDLRGADFRSARLKSGVTANNPDGTCGWILDNTDLSFADFSGADLRDASFKGATLSGAKFEGARLNWCAHDLTAEILRQAAGGDYYRLEAAETVLAHRDWTWAEFALFNGPHHNWCMDVLRPFVRPADGPMLFIAQQPRPV